MNISNYNCIIWLTQGKYAIVDNEDYEWLSQWKWHVILDKSGRHLYAVRNVHNNKKRRPLRMHREIVKPDSGLVVDHINHNGLDNRKNNLRICTSKENSRNSRARKGSSSRYLGVYYNKINKNWRAGIYSGGKQVGLGSYKSEILAAKIYDIHAHKYFNKFANLNFPFCADEHSEIWEAYKAKEAT